MSGHVVPAEFDALTAALRAQLYEREPFRPIYRQEFDVPAGPGEFPNLYPEMSLYDGWPDTKLTRTRKARADAKKAGTTLPDLAGAVYDLARTVTVADGICRVRLHTEDGQPYAAALNVPLWGASGLSGHGLTYGRWEVTYRSYRVQADGSLGPAAGWKAVPLLHWSTSNRGADGERDLGEGGIGGRFSGYAHKIGDNSVNAWSISSIASALDWHTLTIECTPGFGEGDPGRLAYILDRNTPRMRGWITQDDDLFPAPEVRMVCQFETALSGGNPDPAVEGVVELGGIEVSEWIGPGVTQAAAAA